MKGMEDRLREDGKTLRTTLEGKINETTIMIRRLDERLTRAEEGLKAVGDGVKENVRSGIRDGREDIVREVSEMVDKKINERLGVMGGQSNPRAPNLGAGWGGEEEMRITRRNQACMKRETKCHHTRRW